MALIEKYKKRKIMSFLPDPPMHEKTEEMLKQYFNYKITAAELTSEQKDALQTMLDRYFPVKNYYKNIIELKAGSIPLWQAINHVIYREKGVFGDKSCETPEFFSSLLVTLSSIFKTSNEVDVEKYVFAYTNITITYKNQDEKIILSQIKVSNYKDVDEILKWDIFHEIINWKLE